MYSIVFCVCIFISSALAVTEICIPSENKDYSSCACKLNTTNEYINLQPLMNSTVIPRFTSDTNSSKAEEGWKFSYNPCKPYDMFIGVSNSSNCKQVAVSRWSLSPIAIRSVCFDIGVQESVQFDTKRYDLSEYGFDWSNLTLQFTSRQGEKSLYGASIHLVCNSNMTKEMSTFHFLREVNVPHSTYILALESRCSCPGLCGKPLPSPEPTKEPSKESDSNDKWLIIGVSVGAIIFLLLVILAVICCKNKKKAGYTEV